MFNKKKCKTCKYHSNTSLYGRGQTVICGYATHTEKTCLVTIGKETIDRRGKDPNNCQLYEEGGAECKKKIVIH